MPRNDTRSIASAGSESIGSVRHSGLRQRSPSAREERSASNPPSFSPNTTHYDTALPPISFQPPMAHRRTGSTLKTVMRKIFNRKRQSQTDGVEESPHESFYSALPLRNSGPVGEGKSFLAVPPPPKSKRSSPLSERNLKNISETHLSPISSTFPRDALQQRPRRATLPSVVFSEDESRYDVASSAVSDPQEDRPHMPDQERRRCLLQARRRSRSADALRDLVGDSHMSPSPWPPRTASVPTSAPDSKSPPHEGSSTSGRSGRPSTGTTVTSVTRASATPSMSESDRAEQVSLPPNMSSLVHTMQQDDGLTVEQRLNTIEVKMIDLEFAIARMQSSHENTNTERPSRQRHAPSSDSSHMRTKASGFLSSLERDESPSPLVHLPSGRPTSTSTIRPETMNSRTLRAVPSANSLSEFQGVSIEQYSTLVTLLRREQTARRNLESQVSGLRDDIRHMQRAVLQSMELRTMYPVGSMDSQEFLHLRRALDDDASSPIRNGDDRPNGNSDNDSEMDRPDNHARDDPFGPSKWEPDRRIVPAPMI
ncbi:hypothetical protein N7492_008119 [Penicillium capsulatum]|uniref:Uncharacterized protein n=1 Tax=Penicillium capsulatum TaxID=69766 RepID=A0A9W9HSX1_9EURO|nr:hypothetical protein N7492_008119 [Penicillium capsulatum]KAJ6105529.1 hypothetical protein N7512_009046 [Penicillium capsulatum]